MENKVSEENLVEARKFVRIFEPFCLDGLLPGVLIVRIAEYLQSRSDRYDALKNEMAERLRVSNDCLDVELDKRKALKLQSEALAGAVEKMGKLLTQIKNHSHARLFYNIDFLPPCESSKGEKYDHMDTKKPLKCMFAHHSTVGHDWGGLCHGHEKLFNEALAYRKEQGS